MAASDPERSFCCRVGSDGVRAEHDASAESPSTAPPSSIFLSARNRRVVRRGLLTHFHEQPRDLRVRARERPCLLMEPAVAA